MASTSSKEGCDDISHITPHAPSIWQNIIINPRYSHCLAILEARQHKPWYLTESYNIFILHQVNQTCHMRILPENVFIVT